MADQLEQLTKIQLEFNEIVNKWFPDHFVRSCGCSGPNFYAEFAQENQYFKNTEYFYTKPLKFIHLTNYRNLFSIINSRVIRLYNLHNSNDPEEYEYSAKLFEPSEHEVIQRKDNLFTFSFCPIEEINNQNVWGVIWIKL